MNAGEGPCGAGDGQRGKAGSTAPGMFHREVSSFAGAGMHWRGMGARPALELGGGQKLGLSLLPAVSCDHSGPVRQRAGLGRVCIEPTHSNIR